MAANLTLLAPGTFGQVFVLVPGRAKLTTGAADVTGVRAFHCHEDGTITVNFAGSPPETLAFVEGDEFAFEQAATIEITDGVWSFM